MEQLNNLQRTVHVGNLDDEVTPEILHAAFIPFGEILKVHIAIDERTNKKRGIGYVEFDDPEDAADAVDNMSNSELFGKVIKVSISNLTQSRAIWSDETNMFQDQELEYEE